VPDPFGWAGEYRYMVSLAFNLSIALLVLFYLERLVRTPLGRMLRAIRDDEDVANTCRMLRNHGMERRYYHEMLGYNFRLTDLHAAIGLAQIDRLEEMTKKRRENAGYLSANIESVVVPKVRVNVEHVWHQYTVRIDGGRDRDAALQQLNENGVGTGIFYPVPAHKQGYMRQIVGDIHLPVTEQMAEEVFSLPVHPHLTREDLSTIVNEVNKL